MFGMEGFGHLPGIDAVREEVSATLTWGKRESVLLLPCKIDSAVTDPGNTGSTNVLRPGLMLARSDAASTQLVAYDRADTGTDGNDQIVGILAHSRNIQLYSTAADIWAWVIVGGPIVAKRTINPTSGDNNTIGGWVGGANDAAIRGHFESPELGGGQHRFIFDDFYQNG